MTKKNGIDEYSDWLKFIWWIILIVVGAIFIILRYDLIVKGTTGFLDIIILIAWISLLLMPLFQEVSFYGLKLKKEIDILKSDLKEQIVNLRSDIQNSIDVRTQINPQIYLYPPSDSVLPEIEQKSKEILRENLYNQRITQISEEIVVPDKSIYLFSVRHEIEKELRRIWKQRVNDKDTKRPLPIPHIIRSFVDSELINSRLAGVIREVYSVCSPAIHGEEVSETQYAFVRDIAPELIASLKAIQ